MVSRYGKSFFDILKTDTLVGAHPLRQGALPNTCGRFLEKQRILN